MINLDKIYLNSLLGMSCIENYVLYILKDNNINYKLLFYDSYISPQDIILQFLEYGSKYASFYKIPRLHKMATKKLIIKSAYQKIEDKGIINNQYDYICIRVEPQYMKNKYNVTLWRDDHYILLTKNDDNNFYYFNDNPIDSGILTIEEINDISINKIFSFSILDNDVEKNKEIFLEEAYGKLILNNDNIYIKNTFNDIILIRDIIGILRISRKRLFQFYNEYFEVNYMKQYIFYLDKLYSNIEYMRLRSTFNISKVNDMLNELMNKDYELMNKIKHDLEVYLNGNKKKCN